MLFPLAMAMTSVTGVITKPVAFAAFLQFPLYALVVWWLRSGAWRWYLVGLVHGVMIPVAFALANPTFTP